MKRRLQDAFDKIHAEQELKDRTMEFLESTTNDHHLYRTGWKRSHREKQNHCRTQIQTRNRRHRNDNRRGHGNR